MSDLSAPLHARAALASLAGFDATPLGHHQVGVGESLTTIAALWYGPGRGQLAALIVSANFLLSAEVYVGQRLVIPRAGWRSY